VRTIRKYPLIERQIPYGAKVLHLGLQDGQPMVWCETDPNDLEWRRVTAIPTGANPPDHFFLNTKHIGSIVGIESNLVFHFYVEN
jgi:hypothetical protein